MFYVLRPTIHVYVLRYEGYYHGYVVHGSKESKGSIASLRQIVNQKVHKLFFFGIMNRNKFKFPEFKD